MQLTDVPATNELGRHKAHEALDQLLDWAVGRKIFGRVQVGVRLTEGVIDHVEPGELRESIKVKPIHRRS